MRDCDSVSVVVSCANGPFMRLSPLLLIFLPYSALACDYCERKITLTPELAECYLSKFEGEIEQMQDAGLPAQLINLASCEQAQTGKRGGGSLPSPPTPLGTAPLSVSFVLDAPAIRCLARALRSETWSPKRVKTFEVRRDCPQE